jgi:ABC-type glycerol-3-phosphate transport system permease component
VSLKATPVEAQPEQPQRPRHFDYSIIFKHAVLIMAALLVIFPGYFMFITAFKTPEGYSLNKFDFPHPVFSGNFITALRGGRFFLWFGNSIAFSLGAVVLSTAASVLAAFAFARMRFAGRNPLLAIITALIVIPPVVMIIPLFMLLAQLKLISTYSGAILVYAGLLTPFSIYLLTNFFKSIPHEIIEAAIVDGASTFDVLLRIVLPLSGPALMTLIVVNTLAVWNDLLIALVLLPQDEMRTLMVGVTVFGSRYNSDIPVAMAGMLLASIPMLLLYLAGQRYFIRGLVAGAIKG